MTACTERSRSSGTNWRRLRPHGSPSRCISCEEGELWRRQEEGRRERGNERSRAQSSQNGNGWRRARSGSRRPKGKVKAPARRKPAPEMGRLFQEPEAVGVVFPPPLGLD